jgi:hypothetical protein
MNPGIAPTPGGVVGPRSGSAPGAASPDIECSQASFLGVLDSKAVRKKVIEAVNEALARLAKCKPSMDPAVYEDLHRRLFERA